MKNQKVIIWIAVVVLSVASLSAQDAKKMPKEAMNMAEMSKSPHHIAMMAYRQSVLTFATALRDLARDGNIQDVDLARNVFAEIKRSMGEMDKIHQSHMGKMSPEMRERMKPMMEKMQSEKAVMNGHILALEKALEADSPDGQEVAKHATELVSQLEKMNMSDWKSEMPGKKSM